MFLEDDLRLAPDWPLVLQAALTIKDDDSPVLGRRGTGATPPATLDTLSADARDAVRVVPMEEGWGPRFVALSGWGGEHLVEANERDLVVRTLRYIPTMAYAFNASVWHSDLVHTARHLGSPRFEACLQHIRTWRA